MESLSQHHRSLIRHIARQSGVQCIRLFGSRSRGDAGPASDIDLLVRFEPRATLLTVIGFQQAVEELTGLKVDVVEEQGVSPFLVDRILSEAALI